MTDSMFNHVDAQYNYNQEETNIKSILTSASSAIIFILTIVAVLAGSLSGLDFVYQVQ